MKTITPRTSDADHGIKVLHVYPDFGAFGGIERFILTVSQGLKRRGTVEPVVACTDRGRLFQALRDAGISVYGLKTLPCYAKPAWRMADIPTMMQLYRILRRERPDLVHVHIGQLENLLFSGLGYPVVYSFHGYSSLYSIEATPKPLKRCLKRLAQPLFRWMVRCLDTMVFVSDAERQRMRWEGYLPRGYTGEVLHNALDIKAFRQHILSVNRTTCRQSLGIPPEALCLGFINRLDANKNPEAFVSLVERLAQTPELGNLHALMAGDGSLARTIQTGIAQSPIGEHLHLLGHRSDIPDLLACCDIMVHIPHREGFGLGVLEAMAAGVPCVAFAVGGIPEILPTEAAPYLLVPPGDTEGLYRKVLALLDMSKADRDTMKATLQRHSETFDLPPFLQQMEAIYRRVLDKRS